MNLTDKQKVDENYKKCKDRALSILYSIAEWGGLESCYSRVASGFPISELTPKQLIQWNKMVDDIAEHLINVEVQLNEDNTFW